MFLDTYILLDFGNGKRLEQWGPYILVRPDPVASGSPAHPKLWTNTDAVYVGEKGKGEWKLTGNLPEEWPIVFETIKLLVRLSPYKHTGVFPEQQENWKWARAQAAKTSKKLTVLHLFAYTGGATAALAKEGHFVTHVDAARPTIGWAKDNAAQNQLPEDSVRWILDDAAAFAAKELKRGKKYDAIILDPPAFGHSPTGKTWRVERDLKPLLETCAQLLSSTPSFLILNGYAQHDTAESFRRLLNGILLAKSARKPLRIDSKELYLRTVDGRRLSTGIVARVAF